MKIHIDHLSRWWHRFCLDERPSISLSFFRIAVAVTTGFHVLPTFFPLSENYLSGAFKVLNTNFFTPGVLDLIQKSPDSVVVFLVWLFCVAWFFYLLGLLTQVSCIVMTLCCYYFYGLNAFPIATLSWDILLVTLFLMCICPYAGDYFSLDCLLKGDTGAYRRKRPFFIQRLLQIQIAFMYFYTALYKVSSEGNWLHDNPVYYLMNYPAAGVTKYFLIRDWMAAHPGFCYVMGLLIIAVELLMPFLLFFRPTRVTAIYLGLIFHITLMLTMDVPAIFFFLFPAQLLLFIDPDEIMVWIEKKRDFYRQSPAFSVIYDGHCQFCLRSVELLKIMDLFRRLTFVDYQVTANLSALHPDLTKEKAHSQLYLIEPDGKMSGGFYAFRRMTQLLPMLYPTIAIVYFPGMGVIGPLAYRWVAEHRYLFHFNKKCANNSCFR